MNSNAINNLFNLLNQILYGRKKFDEINEHFYRLYSERAQFSWLKENYSSSDYK